MISDIIKQDLNMMKVSTKWVPHNLTEFNKASRVEQCENMKNIYELRSIKRKLITIDENWFYVKSLGCPTSRQVWVTSGGDVPTTSRRTMSDKKFIALVAFNFMGLFHCKVLQLHETVDSE